MRARFAGRRWLGVLVLLSALVLWVGVTLMGMNAHLSSMQRPHAVPKPSKTKTAITPTLDQTQMGQTNTASENTKTTRARDQPKAGQTNTEIDNSTARHARDQGKVDQTNARDQTKVGQTKTEINNTTATRARDQTKGGLPNARICIFALIPFHNATWSQRFTEDFWRWNQEVAVTSFAQQTYTDFTLLARRPPGGFSVKMQVVEMLASGHAQVDEMVAANGTCSWVVSTRLDGDDFLLPEFMEYVVAAVREELVLDPDAEVIVLAQHGATVISVDGDGCQLCAVHSYSILGSGISVGQTLAVRYDTWNRSGGLLINECDHTKVFSMAEQRLHVNQSKIRFHLFRKELGLVMYTRLSGHFPWNDGLPLCNRSVVEARAGFPIISWLENKSIPATPLKDVCQSNRYFSTIRANQFLFNKNETCAQMSQRYGHALLPRNRTRLKIGKPNGRKTKSKPKKNTKMDRNISRERAATFADEGGADAKEDEYDEDDRHMDDEHGDEDDNGDENGDGDEEDVEDGEEFQAISMPVQATVKGMSQTVRAKIRQRREEEKHKVQLQLQLKMRRPQKEKASLSQKAREG